MKWTWLVVVLAACGDDAQPVMVDANVLGDDAPPPANDCSVCTAGQLCIQRFDGTCGSAVSCVDSTESCPPNTCSPACMALCGEPYQCATRPACGTEVSGAFVCYGH